MKRRLIPPILSLLLAVSCCPLIGTGSYTEPPPGPAVRIVPPPAELTAPEPEDAPGPPPKAHVIENCTVTWYTEDTCGKTLDHPAYGITASGLPVEEGVTCAVDPEVSFRCFQATDAGVKGEWVDIYTPDYDYAIQCGLQKLTVYWTAPEEEEMIRNA